jgi:hypothetical protein
MRKIYAQKGYLMDDIFTRIARLLLATVHSFIVVIFCFSINSTLTVKNVEKFVKKLKS